MSERPASPPRLAQKVLLIGWDAADWKVIHPLLDAGLMPALERLVNGGVIGNLATLDPPFSPMLWTSIATGKTADQHGILGFVEPKPDGSGVRPVLGTGRKVKALWNILSQTGLRCNVVGWWPSHPAEPLPGGVMVSNFYQRSGMKGVAEPWPLPPGTIHPPELAETLAAFRVHPGELTAAHVLPFVPQAAEIDQKKDRRLGALARIIADAASVQGAATWLMEHTEWDFMAVYFDAIDHFGHGFMKYHPPRQAHIDEAEYERYSGVVAAGYRFHDMLLDRLLDLAGPETTVILLSDHGFHSDHLRPASIPKIPAGPAIEHRAFGIFAMAGPGVKRDERINGATLLDIAPTVLTLFGLPTGSDMAGDPLLLAFEQPPPVARIPSWDAVPGEDGRHPADLRVDPWAEQEALAQLVELGYIEAGDEEGRLTIERAERESKYALARVHLWKGQAEEAVTLLRPLYEADSKQRAYFGIWLAQALVGAGHLEEAEALVAALQETHPSALLYLLDARIREARGDVPGALAALEHIQGDDLANDEYRLQRADLYLRLHAFEEATDLFEEVARHDPDNARAFNGLAKAAIGLKHYEQAIDYALAAVSRRYFFPEAHFHLGVAFTRLGWMERALQAFKVAYVQAPSLTPVLQWLAHVYQKLGRPAEARAHAEAYQRLSGPPSTTEDVAP